MRATEFISEITRLGAQDYQGGKDELSIYTTPGKKTLTMLPGGSGLQYAIKPGVETTFIYIVDPQAADASNPRPRKKPSELWYEYYERLEAWENRQVEKSVRGAKPKKPAPAIVAKLSINHVDIAIPNAVQVGSITVDEDYRGRGLAKSLYGIVLYIMRKTLVAGSDQTPGGRRNWLSLVNIPGVMVKGFMQIDKDELEHDPDSVYADENYVAKNHDILMKLGGQFIGQSQWAETWAFDVVPGRGELKPAIRTKLNQLYDDDGDARTGLLAQWVGN